MIQAAFSKPEFHGYILEKNLMEGIPCQGQHCANHAAETRQALVPFIWDSAVDFFKTEEAPFIQLIFSQVRFSISPTCQCLHFKKIRKTRVLCIWNHVGYG
jgi:hypothetical protein